MNWDTFNINSWDEQKPEECWGGSSARYLPVNENQSSSCQTGSAPCQLCCIHLALLKIQLHQRRKSFPYPSTNCNSCHQWIRRDSIDNYVGSLCMLKVYMGTSTHNVPIVIPVVIFRQNLFITKTVVAQLLLSKLTLGISQERDCKHALFLHLKQTYMVYIMKTRTLLD